MNWSTFRLFNKRADDMRALVPVPSPVPSEPTKVNKDAIYGSVIGVLALVFGVFIIFKSWRHLKRK